ncbi:prolyl endopeptidase-like isoform X1 [Clarias gariepinus]|uniref:prolyl endopeptidase-like isoform X1 n=2 Tax=Clarias gariepinus TaxID=13013 RepID=UPI00234D1DBF|nr:prolyl endopeptidase-like isoform X1 [Clarias gariepinus]
MISFIASVSYLFLRSVSRSLPLHLCYGRRVCVPARVTARAYSAEAVKADLRKLKRLEKHFERKLRSVYEQFADVPDNTVFQGLHHEYIVKENGVYRAAREEDGQYIVPVLSADWAGDVDRTIQRVRLSPSESMLAATLKSNHNEAARCMLVRLEPTPIPQKPILILDNVFSFEWATDDVLYYTTQEGFRCRHVFRLDLTNSGAHSVLVYEEKDPEFFVEVIRSRDQRLLTINCSSKRSSEVWMIDSWSPFSPPELVQPRRPELVYHVEHSDNQLYILANTGPGHEYELLRTSLFTPAMCYWEPVFSPVPGSAIKDMEMLPDHCVFTLKGPQGRLQLLTFPLKTPNDVAIHHLPSWACAIETERSDTLKSNAVHFLLSSPVHPPARYLFSPTHEQPVPCEEVLQHTAFSECHTTHLQAISQDGTAVPLTLFHTKSISDLSNVPLLLHVYGAYGLDINMGFSPEKRLLLEDNWALAYCHVRGGGECGLAWHRAGCLQNKQNGVDDLTACIQTLFQSGVSQPALTALTARSAGAVLAGALCNQRPHLLRAILLQAPFLDVLSTMQDSSLPLTIEERGEWGDPLADPQDRDNIASYCPCHNITPQLYPPMLITAYSEDSRVPLSGVLKYVEKLKKAIQTHTSHHSMKGNIPAIVLDLQPGGDHFGPQDYDQSMCEIARQLAFLYTTLGLGFHGSRFMKT